MPTLRLHNHLTPRPHYPSTSQPHYPTTPLPLDHSTSQPLDPTTPLPHEPSTTRPHYPTTTRPLDPMTTQQMSTPFDQGLFAHLSLLPDSSKPWVACIPLLIVKIHWPKTPRRWKFFHVAFFGRRGQIESGIRHW